MEIISCLFSGSATVFASFRSGFRASIGARVVHGDGVQEGTRIGGKYNLNDGDSLSG